MCNKLETHDKCVLLSTKQISINVYLINVHLKECALICRNAYIFVNAYFPFWTNISCFVCEEQIYVSDILMYVFEITNQFHIWDWVKCRICFFGWNDTLHSVMWVWDFPFPVPEQSTQIAIDSLMWQATVSQKASKAAITRCLSCSFCGQVYGRPKGSQFTRFSPWSLCSNG